MTLVHRLKLIGRETAEAVAVLVESKVRALYAMGMDTERLAPSRLGKQLCAQRAAEQALSPCVVAAAVEVDVYELNAGRSCQMANDRGCRSGTWPSSGC